MYLMMFPDKGGDAHGKALGDGDGCQGHRESMAMTVES